MSKIIFNMSDAEIATLSNEVVDIPYQVIKTVIDDENSRHANLLAKAQSLTTVSALIFASLGFSDFTTLYSQVPAVIAFGSGLISIHFSLQTLASKDFSVMKHENLLSSSFLTKTTNQGKLSISLTLCEVIDTARQEIDKLYLNFDRSIFYLKIAALATLISFTTQMFLGETEVNKNKITNAGTATSNSGNNGNSGSGSQSVQSVGTETQKRIENSGGSTQTVIKPVKGSK